MSHHRRQMTTSQKKSYIDAVLCLTTKEAISGINGTVNRFDDHQAVHNKQTPYIHFVGHFILWHRYFVATYEKALRDECGYTGGQPYWDWSLDGDASDPQSTKPTKSPVFDPVTGFGGNGIRVVATPKQNPFNLTSTGGGCVQDGPFVAPNFMVNYPGPPSCLRRDFIPAFLNTWTDPKLVENLLSQPTYETFDHALEGTPTFYKPNLHGSGHFDVGGILGQAGNASNSPAEPLFYLHHGNIDHLYWMWQQKDLETRLSQVGGPVNRDDLSGPNVTLDFEVNMGKLAGSVPLRDLMDTEGGLLCYTY
ncbi:monoxygenase [Pyrenophora tritici-repentis Pt-1C-BFP]|uniref:Tyrosinase domain containing protein n=2 Tax=Pyrenophora tritici-repentis TaxID=45151 RepID=A0A922NGH9_9PLEO|nr:monooxygenase [Pyrenophora tritici-repentis Pt-1C-BFP]EDU41090.1 monoxygenase [Pyrenophora tritici-repentis Pt-1C-BFP]KAI1513789.1 Tyrosinase domain containing protein [Pyrenophora tritici-repentis]